MADYVDFDFSPYPAVQAWFARMRDWDGWAAAFASFDGLVNAASAQRTAVEAEKADQMTISALSFAVC